MKVLELWDRMYQFWIVKQRRSEQSIGPEVSTDALSDTFSELVDKVSTMRIFDVSSIQEFIKNNMGTLTSIVEQIWSLFRGNIGFLFETVLGLTRILFYSGSGVVNLCFGFIIYLTALFYLLSNSTNVYILSDTVSQYSSFYGIGVGASLQKAINSVFLITIKVFILFYF